MCVAMHSNRLHKLLSAPLVRISSISVCSVHLNVLLARSFCFSSGSRAFLGEILLLWTRILLPRRVSSATSLASRPAQDARY